MENSSDEIFAEGMFVTKDGYAQIQHLRSIGKACAQRPRSFKPSSLEDVLEIARSYNEDHVQAEAMQAIGMIVTHRPDLANINLVRNITEIAAQTGQSWTSSEQDRVFISIIAKRPDLVTAILNDTKNAVAHEDAQIRRNALFHFWRIIEQYPTLGEKVLPFLEISISDANAEVRQFAYIALSGFVTKRPDLIDTDFVLKIAETVATEDNSHTSGAALEQTLKNVAVHRTDLIKDDLTAAVTRIACASDFLLNQHAQWLLQLLIDLRPEMAEVALNVVHDNAMANDPDICKAAQTTFGILAKKRPDLAERIIEFVKPAITDSDEYVAQAAITTLWHIFDTRPELVDAEIIARLQTIAAGNLRTPAWKASGILSAIHKKRPDLA